MCGCRSSGPWTPLRSPEAAQPSPPRSGSPGEASGPRRPSSRLCPRGQAALALYFCRQGRVAAPSPPSLPPSYALSLISLPPSLFCPPFLPLSPFFFPLPDPLLLLLPPHPFSLLLLRDYSHAFKFSILKCTI